MNELIERPGFLPDVQELIDKQLLAESRRLAMSWRIREASRTCSRFPGTGTTA